MIDQSLNQRIVQRGFYKHFKGHTYFVLGIGTHSETLEPTVVYRRCGRKNELWVRPMSEWLKPLPDDPTPRFKFLGKTLNSLDKP